MITAMGCSWLSRTILATALLAITYARGVPQVGTTANNPAVPTPALPLTTQIKKTVVFLKTDCLHNFEPDSAQLTPDKMSKMAPEEVTTIKQQLQALISRLQRLKESAAKLTPQELAMLKPEVLPTLAAPQMAELVVKMTNLTSEDIAKLAPQEVETLPADTFLGTGFLVYVHDDRLPTPAGSVAGAAAGFGYLVTNRHVVQPGIQDGKPCTVLNYSVLLNKKSDSANFAPHAEMVKLGGSVHWHFSTDDSVDLAVVPFSAPPDVYDYIRIPVSTFVTQDMVKKKQVVEGDPVLFSGLFIQSFNEVHRLEPIVRSGTLAMVPDGLMETTLHKLGQVYLAEAHAFAGNSGSPVFIDANRFANVIAGPSYIFLGVISGEVLENSDLTMHVTTAYTANVGANSDVSIVVPASEVRNILYSPALQGERDAFFARQSRIK